MPLQQRHEGLHAPDHVALIGRHQHEDPSESPVLGAPVPDFLHRASQAVDEPTGVELHGVEVGIHQPLEVASQPRCPPELNAMRDLVQRDPHPELSGGEAELLLDARHIRPDEVDQSVVIRRKEHVVLAEDAVSQIAEEPSKLRAQHGPPDRGSRTVGPAGEHLRRDRLEDPLETPQVRLKPLVAAHDPCPRPIGAGGKSGELLHESFGFRDDLGEILRKGGPLHRRHGTSRARHPPAHQRRRAPIHELLRSESHGSILPDDHGFGLAWSRRG